MSTDLSSGVPAINQENSPSLTTWITFRLLSPPLASTSVLSVLTDQFTVYVYGFELRCKASWRVSREGDAVADGEKENE